MAWYTFGLRRGAPVQPPEQDPVPLVAAASPIAAPRAELVKHVERWQNDAWGYYDTLGELNYGVAWLANMMSRVRLRAGELDPGNDEPTVVDNGPAAEIMSRLGNGIGGRSELMRRITVLLSVPGEGYLIGETVDAVDHWQVRSVDEVRVGSNDPETGTGFQITDEDTVNTGMYWRDLAPDSMNPIRIWRPHDRWYHLADSPLRSGLTIMRELELVNRKITAEYLSRLASAGVLVVPEEMSFPVREEFKDADDPFALEFIELAAEGIKNPGAPSSIIPLLIKVPAEFVDKVKHIDFTLKLDEKIIERRDQAIHRLATKLDIPSDVMLGLGDSNHWSAWAVEESGLKVHVAPLAELICDSLTRGYLHPQLKAMGEDPSKYVVWYDMSELTLRPDRAANAEMAYDRLELSGKAFRRETGFSEDDAPTAKELEQIGLKALIRTSHGAAPGALDALVGHQVVTPATQGPGSAQTPQGPIAPPGEPQTPEEKAAPPPAPPAAGKPTKSSAPPAKGPPPPQGPSAASAARRAVQARTQHAVSFRVDGAWDLRHPDVCRETAYSCPFTHAVSTNAPVAAPGTPGTYLCRLDAFGQLCLDGQALYLDTSGMLSTVVVPHRVNGMAHA